MNDPWSQTRWKSLEELVVAMRKKASAGQTIVLSPATAWLLIQMLDRPDKGAKRDRWRVDLYEEGSCIYQLDAKGEIFRVEAWARGTIAARAALESLREKNPMERYSQRRRGWVEG